MNAVEALLAEMNRVRDEVMPPYRAIGAPGMIAVVMMKASLRAADRALAAGPDNAVEVLAALQDLKGYKT